MLESAGAKKLHVGEAQVSSQHANFIINKGHAKASEIRTLIEAMREAVLKKFNITLEEEIEYVGQW
jgi:UDP-N-acetylmuramate dehydrogenase